MKFAVRIHNHIKISPVVFYLNLFLVAAFPGMRTKFCYSRLELAVNCHVVVKESVATDMLKADFFLYQL